MSEEPAFTLEPGRWYAMTMYPGYLDKIYRSPVELHALQPRGSNPLELEFFNLGYAPGVQGMTKAFQVIRRHPQALITQELGDKDRITIFEPLTIAWVTAFTPRFGDMMIDALQQRRQLSGR